ncbi:MAG: hypothetical protein M3O67_01715, partial [Bacteroidota bacterium]|nr:hypothetical protein [Bacteroidota bacterium]
EYASLQKLYDVIRRSPEAFSIIKPADYSSFITTYREKAGDVYYERGMRWMEKDDKETYKKAYREFHNALRFKQGDITIRQKMDEAYNAAVTNVVLLPMQDFGYSYSSNSNTMQNFENEVIRNLQNHVNNDFVRFYSGWDARSHHIEPDQEIEMRLNNLNIGHIHDDRQTREVSKEVVIKETVYKPDSIVKQYGRVYAKITTTKRTMISEGNLNINIRDDRGRWLWNDNFRGDHYWATEFATYTGDERALSEQDKQLLNHREDYPPREEDIVEAITRNINNDMLYRVRDFYNRF